MEMRQVLRPAPAGVLVAHTVMGQIVTTLVTLHLVMKLIWRVWRHQNRESIQNPTI